MSSLKKISLYLAKDVELNTDLSDGSFTPAISIKADNLEVDKNGTGDINPVNFKAIRDAVQGLKSQCGERAMIEFTPAGHDLDYYNRVTSNSKSVNVTVLKHFRKLNPDCVLANAFIKIDGTIHATCGVSLFTDVQINIRVNLNDLAAEKLHEVELETLGSELEEYRNSPVQMQLRISIMLEWTQQVVTSVELSRDSIVQKMYSNESIKDYMIVASNGVKIKCHGLILAAHSPVLEKMINPSNGMKESQSKVIEAQDISEDGVKCLLQYLYGLKLSVDGWKCELITELFQAAHYYELEHLEKSLEEILLQRYESWYTPDSILELYFFVKLLDQFGALRDHLLQIMTRMSKEIRKCERMKTLSVNDKVDLLWELFDVVNTNGEEVQATTDSNA